MNDMPDNQREEIANLQRMLEEVTAEGTHPAEREEGVELREAWLAFGRLLEAGEEAQPMQAQIRVKPRNKATAGRFALLAAAAAALCMAMGLGWWLTRGGAVGRVEPVAVKQQPAAPNAPAIAQKNTSAGRAATSAWDDAIDTQIVAVSQEIESVRQTWQHRVDEVDLVRYRIDEVSAGLANDAL